MSLPRYPGKWSRQSVWQAGDLLKALNPEKKELWPGFKTCVLLYQSAPLQKLKNETHFSQSSWLGLQFHWLSGSDVAVVTGLGMGAPALAMKVEEMIALGVEKFVLLGTAGSLSATVGPGSILLIDRAIRDEGVSYHYLDPEEPARSCEVLAKELSRGLDSAGVPYLRGTTWTTDAIYRETHEECDHYASEGVLSVEMEAAALFAVARYRGKSASALVVVSDIVSSSGWQPFLRDVRVKNGLYQALETLMKVTQTGS